MRPSRYGVPAERVPPYSADLSPPEADSAPRRAAVLAPPPAVIVLAAALAAAVPGFAGPAEDLLSVGRKAFADGQYPLAVESFQRVRDDYPESAVSEEASYLLGVSLFYDGRWPEALAAFSLLADRHPGSALLARASYWSGAADLKLGSWQAALDSLSSFLENPGGATAYLASARLFRAVALEGLGRDGEAAAVYRQLLTEAPTAANAEEITYRLAGTEFRAGRFASARDLYGRILLAPPARAGGSSFVRDAVFFTAECELSLGNLPEAERRYRTILSLYPDSPWVEAATYRLAETAWKQRRPGALRQVQDFLDRFPTGTWRGSALRLRGDILSDRKRPADAAADYQAALALLPKGAESQSAWYSLALALLAVQRKADAADALRHAGEGPLAATAENAGFQRAVLLAGLGRTAEAIEALRSFLAAFPGSARAEQAGRLLAALLEKQGEPEASRASWDWLARRFPDSAALPEYLYLRGRQWMAAGSWTPALDDFQRVVKDYPGTPWSARSTYAIGWVYARRGEYPRALPFFQAASRDPGAGTDAARGAFSAAICLFDMGRFDQALTAFRALRAPYPPEATAGTVALYAGRSLYRMGRLDEAAAALSGAAAALAAESSPLGADALYWKGWALLRQQKPAEAFSSFLAVAEGYPSDPRRLEALFRAGVSKAMERDDDAAVALFDEVTAAPGSSAVDPAILEQAMYEKGLALGRLGRGDDSTASLEALARAFPGSGLAAQAFYSRAENAFSRQQFDDARAGFDRVAREFPLSPLAAQAGYWSAESSLRTGDTEAALQGFWRCLAGAPGSSPSSTLPSGLVGASVEGFSSALAQRGDPGEARQFAEKARAADGIPAEASAGVLLAAAEVLLPSFPQEARAIVDEVSASAPPEPYAGQASLLLGMYAAARQDWNRALDILGSLEGSRADDVGARAALEKGRTLERMGRTAEAVDEYLKVAYLFPDLADRAAEGMFNAVRLARTRGEAERAARIEAALRKSWPRSPWTGKLPPQ